MTSTFASLGLSASILQDIARAGFLEPTPIQAQGIPAALQGRDVLGCAQTGTGKTAAFVIPMVERLADDPAPQVLRDCLPILRDEMTRHGYSVPHDVEELIGE